MRPPAANCAVQCRAVGNTTSREDALMGKTRFTVNGEDVVVGRGQAAAVRG